MNKNKENQELLDLNSENSRKNDSEKISSDSRLSETSKEIVDETHNKVIDRHEKMLIDSLKEEYEGLKSPLLSIQMESLSKILKQADSWGRKGGKEYSQWATDQFLNDKNLLEVMKLAEERSRLIEIRIAEKFEKLAPGKPIHKYLQLNNRFLELINGLESGHLSLFPRKNHQEEKSLFIGKNDNKTHVYSGEDLTTFSRLVTTAEDSFRAEEGRESRIKLPDQKMV